MTMSVFGVTPQGFSRKTSDDILTEVQADELAEVADDLDISTESIAGQFNGIFCRQLGIAWEALEQCYNGFDADTAEGRLLEMLAKLTGTFRIGSTASQVDLVVDVDNGVTLVAGQHFAADDLAPDVRWTPKANYTATSSGLVTRTFVSELLGPIQGFAGNITIIATPLVGWNSVFNPNDAALGKEIDTDPILRTRRENELATIGSATVRAVSSKVARAFASKLDNLLVNENDTDVMVDGLPPHAIEVLIFDGDIPTIDNDALAQVIYDAKAGGIQAYGNASGQAKALVNGVTAMKTVGFSRADRLDVWLELDIGIEGDYVGDQEVKDLVALDANVHFSPGRDVTESPIRAFPFSLPGVEKVTAVRMGLTQNPVASTDIPVSFRQVARFDSSRIKITSALPTAALAPVLAYLSVFQGPAAGGTSLYVYGSNFVSGAVVAINGVPCTNVSFVNSGQLGCTTPAMAAGVYDVVVTNPDGQYITLPRGFSYIAAAPPVVNYTSAPSGSPTAGGATLYIFGSGFVAGTLVTIGGTACTTWMVDPTQLGVITPAKGAGSYNIVATNPDGQSSTLVNGYVATVLSTITLTTVSPNNGPQAGNTSITLTGTGFVSGCTVKIGGVSCTNVVRVSATSVTAKTAAGASGAQDVIITNPDAQFATKVGGFTYAAVLDVLRGTNLNGMEGGYAFNQASGPVANTDYPVHSNQIVDYFVAKKINVIRFLFSWERMQSALNGPIPAASSGNYKTYFDNYKRIVDYATSKGITVLVEPWQYSSVTGNTSGPSWRGAIAGGPTVGGVTVTNANFSDFWSKMAAIFASNPLVMLGLCNEPNGINTMTWFATAQAAITAIRAAGFTGRLLIPGNGYTGASSWTSTWPDSGSPQRTNGYGWLNARGPGLPLLDPLGKLVVGVHTYADTNAGGGTTEVVSGTIFRQYVDVTVAWARANGLKVLLGEIGEYASAPNAQANWTDFVAYADANIDTLIGYAWWAAGAPGWWDDVAASGGGHFSITPTSNYTVDTVNMTMIAAAFAAVLTPPVGGGPPQITSAAPSTSTPAGGTTFLLNGSAFVSGCTVTMGGTSCTTTFVSATQLSCIAPPKAAGTYSLVVTNPDAQTSGATGNNMWTVSATVTPQVTLGTRLKRIFASGTLSGTNCLWHDTVVNDVLTAYPGTVITTPSGNPAVSNGPTTGFGGGSSLGGAPAKNLLLFGCFKIPANMTGTDFNLSVLDQWNLYMDLSTGLVRFFGSTTPAGEAYSNASLRDGAWHRFAAHYSNDGSAGIGRLWIDGTLQTGQQISGGDLVPAAGLTLAGYYNGAGSVAAMSNVGVALGAAGTPITDAEIAAINSYLATWI